MASACREHGAVFIVDEIFTGFGRTGRLFAFEHSAVDHEDVRPDLVCCGKALGGGLPIAAVVGRRELMDAWRTAGEALHSATFVGHPLSCAAAEATLDVIDDEKLVERAFLDPDIDEINLMTSQPWYANWNMRERRYYDLRLHRWRPGSIALSFLPQTLRAELKKVELLRKWARKLRERGLGAPSAAREPTSGR